MSIKSITVFCGASLPSKAQEFITQTKILGQLLAKKDIRLVYGGSSVGLMGIVATSCIENGGDATGIIFKDLTSYEKEHALLTDYHIVDSLSERKILLNDLGDAYAILPGGVGTLDEFFEILVALQLGQHHKPIAILNSEHYYDGLIESLQHMVDHGFIEQDLLDIIIIEDNAHDLIEKLSKAKEIHIDFLALKAKQRDDTANKIHQLKQHGT